MPSDTKSLQELRAEQDAYDALSRIHLAGVEADEAAALGLIVERARLLLYGSLAFIAGALTASWTGERTVCAAPLNAGILLLAIGASGAWLALQSAETYRWTRMSRKYAALRQAQAELESVEKDDEPAKAFKAAYEAEKRASNSVRAWSTGAYSLSSFGGFLVISGALAGIGTASCWAFTWPLLAWLN